MSNCNEWKLTRLQRYVAEFPDYEIQGNFLFCKLCRKLLTASRKFTARQHLSSSVHLEKIKERKRKLKKQSKTRPSTYVTKKKSWSDRLAQYVTEFPDFETDGVVLFCKLCDKAVSAHKKYSAQQHIKSMTHVENVNKRSKQSHSHLENICEPMQQIKEESTITSERAAFLKDMCKAFVASDIPLIKIKNVHFKAFMEKYVDFKMPSETHLCTMLCSMYKSTIDNIKGVVKGRYVWISIDETTDDSGLCLGNVVLGILDSELKSSTKFLIHTGLLEKADHTTIARLFNDAINALGPEFNKDLILLLITDAAPYLVKAAEAIQVFYPKIMHVTCLAHGLHRICAKVREIHPDVDRLIENAREIFDRAPLRMTIFKNMAPDLSLPTQPVTNRWGTWLKAALYYATNFKTIEHIVNTLDPADSQAVQITQKLLKDECVCQQLVSIKDNYQGLVNSIAKLETPNLSLAAQIKVIEDVEASIYKTGIVAVQEELYTTLLRNPGFEVLKKIVGQLSDQTGITKPIDNYDIFEIVAFRNAPITCVDVEKTFPMYKTVCQDNQDIFLVEKLADYFVVYCNNQELNSI